MIQRAGDTGKVALGRGGAIPKNRTPLALARAEVLKKLMAPRGRLEMAAFELQCTAEDTGLTRAQIDAAVDILVERGEAVLEARRDGVRVFLTEAARGGGR